MNDGLYDDTFAERDLQGSLRSAEVIAPLVLDCVPVARLLDVGCGTGAWMKAFRDLGVAQVEGWDGTRFSSEQYVADPSTIEIIDLEAPLPQHDVVDLVVCLEVAEHLPPERADLFVAELCRLGSTVLFSAAIPGQGGTGHRNEQFPSYWVKRFAENEYHRWDALRPRIWDNSDVEVWYRQNVLLFSRSYKGFTPEGPLDIVHPATIAHLTSGDGSPSLRHIVSRELPRSLRRALARRLPRREERP